MGNIVTNNGKKCVSYKATAIYKNIRRYKTFSGPRAKTRANQWIIETENTLRTGQLAPTAAQGRVTIGEAMDAYTGLSDFEHTQHTRKGWRVVFADLKARHRGVLAGHSPTSWDKEVSTLRQIGSRFGYGFPIASITPDHVLAWIADMRDQDKADATIRNTIRQLQWLIRTAIIELNVIYHVNPYDEALRILAHRGAQLRYRQRERRISEEEYAQITAALHTQPTVINLLITFAIETAMRRGEIAAMRWEDVDLKKRIARLPKTKTDKQTGRQGRIVPLSPVALKVLSFIPQDRPLVFNMEPDSITQAFQRVCDQAGITDLHFHDLRHEGVSRMFEVYGWGPDKVGGITGQSWTTLRRYTHHRPETIAQEMEAKHTPLEGEWEEVREAGTLPDGEDLQAFLLHKLENGDPKMLELLAEYQDN